MKKTVKHFFLAEDDDDDYYIFSKTVRELTSEVKLTRFETCEGLLEALEPGNDLPDLIVLDLNIPLMGGQSCLVFIKEVLQLQHIPVVIMSTSNFEPMIKKAYESGAYKYFTKAYSPGEQKKIISQMIVICELANHS